MIPSFEKIHHKNTVGNNGAVAFQVNTDPAIMKRLSDDVYQDPIGAIIRELATNAFDAHIDAKAQNVPFDISIPTETDQIYRIRDYGTGLSQENLLNMYTQYANSTRRDSNNHIGSIGIGSKSPFAYTSQFSVISYFNGEKISALCYKDEQHMPYMQILGVEKTVEPNGLEIYFPIKSEDIKVFKEKAVNILQWFKVKPNTNIKLDYSTTISENIFVEEPNSWAFYKKEESVYSYGSMSQVKVPKKIYKPLIVMGNVCYEANVNSEPFANLLLHANIGDVDINLSRESIQDNPKNRAWITKKLASVKLEVKLNFEKKIASVPALYDAMLQKQEFDEKTGHSGNVTYRGADLPTALHLSANGEKCWFSRVEKFRNRSGPYNGQVNPKFLSHPVIFADIKNGYIKAAKHYLKTLSDKDNSISEVTLVEGNLQDFLKITEYPQSKVALCSKYYSKPTSGTSNRITSQVLLFDANRQGITNMYQSRWWKDTKIDVVNHHKNTGKTLLYVLIDRYNLSGVKLASIESINDLVDLKQYDVIGVKLAKEAWVKSHKIQHLDDYLKNKKLTQAEEDFLFNYSFSRDFVGTDKDNRLTFLEKELFNSNILNSLIPLKDLNIVRSRCMRNISWRDQQKVDKLKKFDTNKVFADGQNEAARIKQLLANNMNVFLTQLITFGIKDRKLQKLVYEGWKKEHPLEFKKAENIASQSSVTLP